MLPTALHQISSAITIGSLQTSLEGAVVFEEATSVRSALRELDARNFDQAPVVGDGLPIGYVLRSELQNSRGRLASHVRHILPSALVSARCPLEDALPRLESTRFLFVLDDLRISGFVVPSDLNRQAGRAYFALATTSLELELAEVVRYAFSQTDVLSLLPHQNRSLVERRLKQRTEADVEADVIAELTLTDLFRIVRASSELCGRIRLGDNANEGVGYKDIIQLRNRVAHPAKPLLQSQGEFQWLVAVSEQTQNLPSRVSAVAAALPPHDPSNVHKVA